MDYTSVPNIMKVIRPLFLDELEEEFEKIIEGDILPKTKIERLQKLWARISKIKIFDPACGSGNFLIITYKKLRELENNIIESLNDLSASGISVKVDSQIKLENFFGIEIDDFAHELAILSLYIAAHQMNIEFEKKFGKKLSIIPLKDNPKIVCANAARIDWQDVCPNLPREPEKRAEQSAMFDFGEPTQENLLDKIEEWDEIYLIGNPPYKGSNLQTSNQKLDLKESLSILGSYKNLDYISIWFKKGADYIRHSNSKLAFITTNSICQGEQVGLLWPHILDTLEIGFTHKAFKWSNNAKDQAGVTTAVISLRNVSNKPKYIFSTNKPIEAKNISPFLIDSDNIFLTRLTDSISNLPLLVRGSMPTDGGSLTLTENDKNRLIRNYPESEKLIKRYLTGGDFLNGGMRWCLWIEDSDLAEANNIPEIKERLERVSEFRLKSKAPSTVEYAKFPNRFRQKAYKNSDFIILPLTSSENREYIPMNFMSAGVVVTNSAGVIYDAKLWLFALLESKMHMVWIRTVCGKLKTDYRYSSTLGYNTFPVPPLSPETKQALEKSAKEILFARENHTEKTLAQMYDPAKMPTDLREAHTANDALVDSIYSAHGFENDEQRLVKLFEMYEQMTKEEK